MSSPGQARSAKRLYTATVGQAATACWTGRASRDSVKLLQALTSGPRCPAETTRLGPGRRVSPRLQKKHRRASSPSWAPPCDVPGFQRRPAGQRTKLSCFEKHRRHGTYWHKKDTHSLECCQAAVALVHGWNLRLILQEPDQRRRREVLCQDWCAAFAVKLGLFIFGLQNETWLYFPVFASHWLAVFWQVMTPKVRLVARLTQARWLPTAAFAALATLVRRGRHDWMGQASFLSKTKPRATVLFISS